MNEEDEYPCLQSLWQVQLLALAVCIIGSGGGGCLVSGNVAQCFICAKGMTYV